MFLEAILENKISLQISLVGSERRGNLNTQCFTKMVIQIRGHIETVFKYKSSKITAQQMGDGVGESGRSGRRVGRGNWDWYVKKK